MPLIRLGSSPLGGGLLPQELTVSVPPFKFGTTRLGTSTSKFRSTIQLGRYVFGGGGFTPPDPRNASIFWSTGTTMTILAQKNGVTEQFTSREGIPGIGSLGFNRPLPKLGLSFTLGYGGVIVFTGQQTDSPEFDGHTDFAITATKLTGIVGNGWFQWNLNPTPLTGTTPSGTVSKIDIRVAPYEYLDGVDWLASPYLYYSPYNVRHINTTASLLSADAFPQNRLTTYVGAMPQWVFHVPVIAQYTKINVQDTISIQLGLSPFSSTSLTGTTPSGTVTFNSSEMIFSSYKVRPAIYLVSGSINVAAINMDGTSTVSILASQISHSNINMNGVGSWVMNASKSWAGTVNMDGHTNVSIVPNRLKFSGFEADGITDFRITDTAELQFGFEGDGKTDFSITPFRFSNGIWSGDGKTDFALTVQVINGEFLVFDGRTNVSFTANETYTFGNTFNMDGHTAEAITARQSYAGRPIMDGSTAMVIPTTIATFSGQPRMDGHTQFTLDTVADYFIRMNMDGHTNVADHAAYIPKIQIVITGVGDSFIAGVSAYQTNLHMDGATNITTVARFNAAGFFQIFTGLQTDVHITPNKVVNVHMHMDGSCSVFVQTAADQFGEVVFDQINQLMTAVGSFIFSDGSMFPAASSNLILHGTDFTLGPDYLWGIIKNKTGFGSPDYLPVFSGTFTNTGKVARGNSINDLGATSVKYAFGFSRQAKDLYDKKIEDNTREEWVRFNFFVSEALDNTEISNTIGFTNSGVTAIAEGGYVGFDRASYVTFSVLTHALLTQENMEVLATGNPFVRMSQFNYEMLWIPDSHCRNTQTVEEVLYLANLAAIQQMAVETISDGGSRNALLDQVALEMLYTIKAAVIATQATLEALQGPANPSVQSTQQVMEVLTLNQLVQFAAANIQQVAVATAHNGNPNARLIQSALENLFNNAGNSRVESTAVEALGNGNSDAVVNQVTVAEVNNSTTFAGACEQVAVEMLVRPEFDGTVGSLVNNPRYHI